MAFARRLGVVSILGACWFAAVACSDDEDRKDSSEDGGEGGDEGGGKAGTPSVGGNSSNGGKAGMSSGGKAGSSTAGEGGSGTAGDAGSGSGGDAGSGGIMGGAGGEGGSITLGGEGGLSSGGAGGEGGVPVALAQSCVDVCEDDDDCSRADALRGDCNDVTKTCEDPSTQSCSSHEDCGGSTLFWSFGCTTSEDCDFGYICVDYRSQVYCAVDGGEGCDIYQAVTATLHEGGADVEICVDPNARCAEGKCIANCEDVGCAADEGDTCNPVSGRCECGSGAECATGVCENNLCTQCATDEDCAAGAAQTGLDTCVAGKCGCTDVGSCPGGEYPAATNACQ